MRVSLLLIPSLECEFFVGEKRERNIFKVIFGMVMELGYKKEVTNCMRNKFV